MAETQSVCEITPEGAKVWKNSAGQYHRENGPAVEEADGTKWWYFNGQRHRVDGPAIEWADGTKKWWFNGQLHRTDGPAIEDANGSKQWYFNGQRLSEEEIVTQIRKNQAGYKSIWDHLKEET